jgi:hypothetical protein
LSADIQDFTTYRRIQTFTSRKHAISDRQHIRLQARVALNYAKKPPQK